jgi:hypothetical protein
MIGVGTRVGDFERVSAPTYDSCGVLLCRVVGVLLIITRAYKELQPQDA